MFNRLYIFGTQQTYKAMITQQQPLAIQAEDWFSIEPNDRYNFVGDTLKNPKGYAHASIYVSTGGNISLVSECGSIEVFENVPNGWTFPGKVVRIHASGTTASGIKGFIQRSKLEVEI
jgi:hypothetical protein